jgi:(1->4)-alpha-D-glucan 1-alpha-D-glucosylmutase
LIEDGKLHGLRIDHPDGLYDPEAYFHTLQARIAALAGAEAVPSEKRPGFYLAVEKILEADEDLPDWPIAGTTGYDFLNLVNGLLLWPGAEPLLDGFYRTWSGLRDDFGELQYQSKRLILKVALSAELTVLANGLGRIAEADRRTRDYSLTGLRDALREVIACFPVYRTYINEEGVPERDRAYVEAAVEEAKRRSPVGDLSVFDFVQDVLLLAQAEGKGERYREQILAFAMKFQQVTGPVMAKGMEDTLFYRYFRLVSLNEVGGDPRRFAVSPEEFHRRNGERADRWPDALLGTATHDTKRGEDVRARIAVISEVPDAWVAAVERWGGMNRRFKTWVDSEFAPSNNDEYLIYQTLLGTWPAGAFDAASRADYRARLEAYLTKAMREAKLFSSWLNPNQAYEDAALGFLSAILEPSTENSFLPDFLAFRDQTARAGFHNGLAQALFKLASPGIPDIYQGTELWDLSLVDPDNRRPVDFRRRRALAQEFARWDELHPGALAEHLKALAESMEDGRIKFFLTRETLRLRRRHEALFRHGRYRPVRVSGERAAHLCAFLREWESESCLVAVPRWTLRLLGQDGRLGDAGVWGETVLELPDGAAGCYVHAYSREPLDLEGLVAPNLLFRDFPLALLLKAD